MHVFYSSHALCLPRTLEIGTQKLRSSKAVNRSSCFTTLLKSLLSISNASTCFPMQLNPPHSLITELPRHILPTVPAFPSPTPRHAVMPSQQLPLLNLIHHLQSGYPLLLLLIHTFIPQLIHVRSSTSFKSIGFHSGCLRFKRAVLPQCLKDYTPCSKIRNHDFPEGIIRLDWLVKYESKGCG